MKHPEGALSALLLCGALAACSDPPVCTLDLKVPVTVLVETLDGEPPDSVAVENWANVECDGPFAVDAGAPVNTAALSDSGTAALSDSGTTALSDSGTAALSDSGAQSRAAFRYHCYEQGGGNYIVRVTQAQRMWTERVKIAADECHTLEHKLVHITLDPATAD